MARRDKITTIQINIIKFNYSSLEFNLLHICSITTERKKTLHGQRLFLI